MNDLSDHIRMMQGRDELPDIRFGFLLTRRTYREDGTFRCNALRVCINAESAVTIALLYAKSVGAMMGDRPSMDVPYHDLEIVDKFDRRHSFYFELIPVEQGIHKEDPWGNT
jgi:hypothetical protein